MAQIDYIYSIIGDCSNTSGGTFSLSYTAASPPLSVTWVDPTSGASFSSQTLTTNPYVVTGLTAGTYSIEIYDTPYISPQPSTIPITFTITSSCTISLNSVANTTCGANNGSIYAYIPINYGNNLVTLYSGDLEISTVTASTNSNYLIFSNLPAGVYYATVTDFGGCSGVSSSVVVQGSSQLDFGLYTVNNSACVVQKGQIYVTGLTGNGPYTYEWGPNISPSFTGSSVSGLSTDSYSVTITDSFGCSATKSAEVQNTEKLIVAAYTPTFPTCYSNNGSITFYIEGGASPYYYYLSNGDTQILVANQVTFTGLSSNDYTLLVNDAGLCSTQASLSLYTQSSFSVVQNIKQDASCNQLGSISTTLQGGSPPFYFSLSGNNGTVTSQATNLLKNTFSNLNAGDYVISVYDSVSACTYSETVSILNNRNFSISLTGNTSTCLNFNGSVNVEIIDINLTGQSYTYYLSNGLNSASTTATTFSFSGLPSGLYTVTAIDSTNCAVSATTLVQGTQPYQVFLYPTDCSNGNGGTITALIQETDGPYNLTWSNNVNGQTGIFVTGLTAGTYTLTVSGNNNCVTSRSVNITCPPKGSTSYSFKYSTGVKETTPSSKLTLKNMMYSGYTSLVSNASNCTLSSATFNFKVDIGGTDYEFPFYYTESFDNIPDLNYFAPIIESSILTIPNIESCTVEPDKNTINILAKADSTTEYYKGETISFTIKIYFIIKCISVNNIVCV
jgi:hypothetical protein